MQNEDSFRHKGLRAKLVDDLKAKGITSIQVLNAVNAVPRHQFLDSSFVKFAYQDTAFPIGAGQTISQPSTVAFQSQYLNAKPGGRILEVGTGSGYQTAVLCEMGFQVFSIERQPELYKKAQTILQKMGYSRIKLFLGDGYEGLLNLAPFDGILVAAGAAEMPQKLLLQLKIGANMVVPIGTNKQTMTIVNRISEDDFEQRQYGDCAFVPMLSGVAGR